MASTFGTSLRATVFGQSHSPAVGCVLEGLPAGLPVDLDGLQRFVDRRSPGSTPGSTARRERDLVRVVGGLNPAGRTCGAPFAALLANEDARPGDYARAGRVPRPGHADLAAELRWHGEQDPTGGGHFSGRLTAPLCVAGGVALQWLATRGVEVRAHVAELAGVADAPLEAHDNSPQGQRRLRAQMDALASRPLEPFVDREAGRRMAAEVARARAEGDTVGGIVECVACGMPAGCGEPTADGIENVLARDLFAIPAVKGVEFGRGFAAARLRGSQDNDAYELRDGRVVPRTNSAGGVLGGITTGAPVHVRVAVKPIPTLGRAQDSVDLDAMAPAQSRPGGRHDATAVIRAVPVVEAVVALGLADALLSWPAHDGKGGLCR